MSVGGCAVQSPEGAFQDVQSVTADRGGSPLHWNRGGPEDAAVTAKVRELVARELTADTAVQVALLNNRGLQATYQELGVAQADVVRAALPRNPVFDAEIRVFSRGSTGMEVGLVQDFLDTLLIPLRKSLATTAFEGAKLRVAGEVIDLAVEVRRAFISFQGAGQALELRRTVLRAAEASADLARRLRRAGNLTEGNRAVEQLFFEEARLNVAAAEEVALVARERLTGLLGLWGSDTEWRAAPRLTDPPAEETALEGLEKVAVGRSLDLAAARNDIVLFAQQLGVARPLAIFPEAGLGGSGEREPEGQWGFGPAVVISVPLFDWGQASVAAARARLGAARERYAALAVDIRSQVRAARARLLSARRRAEHYRKVVLPLRDLVVSETQKQYNAMLVGAFQLLQAKEQEVESAGRYVETLKDYWLARAGLEQLLNGRRPMVEMPEPGSAAAARRNEGGNH
ncbi:MAG: TolC family protein [Gemmataceae bacterium]